MIAHARPVFSPSAVPSLSPSLLPFRARTFERLRSMDLFARMPDRDLHRLAASAVERRVARGRFITRQEEPEREHLFVILDGEAAMTWENGDGDPSLLATLRPGDTVGETDLFDPGARSASVRAMSAVRLLALHREAVLRDLRENPGLAFGFLGEMARRLDRTNRRMAGICNQRVPRRVAAILVSMLEEEGLRSRDDAGRPCAVLRPRPTQRRIADLSGTARETVSRLFSEWAASGLLADGPDDFRVFDEPRLRRLAGEK